MLAKAIRSFPSVTVFIATALAVGWLVNGPRVLGQRLVLGDYSSSVWTGSTFDGTYDRDFQVDRFSVSVSSSRGGFDTAVTREPRNVNVDDVHEDFFVYSEFSVQGNVMVWPREIWSSQRFEIEPR